MKVSLKSHGVTRLRQMPSGSRGQPGHQSSHHLKRSRWRLGRRMIEGRIRSRFGTSKHRNYGFGKCQIHTAVHAHSTSHLVHCNIVPCQATPSINPTYANSIRNLELKHMVTDRYVTPSPAHHQQPPQRGCLHQRAQCANPGRWGKEEGRSRRRRDG